MSGRPRACGGPGTPFPGFPALLPPVRGACFILQELRQGGIEGGGGSSGGPAQEPGFLLTGGQGAQVL